jgi:hypothetical protein
MKTKLLFLALIFSFLSYSQTLKTEDFNMYLSEYVTSEVNIARGMYMTNNTQYFYEGSVEVIQSGTDISKTYNFFFSSWDKKYIEYAVRDKNFLNISPNYIFTDNNTLSFTDDSGASVKKTLKNSSNVENTILSAMLVWLESKPDEK